MMALPKATKSFFDQDHKNKVNFTYIYLGARSDKMKQAQPTHWRRPQNRAPLNETSCNIAPQKPPIPPTSQARSKLEAFQFVQGQPNNKIPASEEKENKAVEHQATAVVAQSDTSRDAAVSADQSAQSDRSEVELPTATPQLAHANTFPCTPGTRLPLEDLIGNFDEDIKKEEPTEQAPEEHIGWIPNSSSTLLTPNRKRKRATSSSPSCPNTSSQSQEASVFFPGTAVATDKTPEADPAADLWQRYGAAKQTDSASNLPDISQLIFQRSPRALKTPAKSAGLRRWASTGNDWPNSRSKRRKTNGTASINLWQQEQITESGSKSKVASMLDKLQESLAAQNLVNPQPKPALRVEGPSSSSPLPEVGAADSFNGVPAASPLQAKQPSVAHRSEILQQPNDISRPTNGPVQQPIGANTNQGAAFKHVDTIQGQPSDSVISAPLHLQCKAPLPAYKRPAITRTPSTNAQQRTTVPSSAAGPATLNVDLDEFGDDLELSAEDLEELMSQPPPLHQRPLHQIPAHPDPPPQQQLGQEQREAPEPCNNATTQANQPICVDSVNDDDDEFGCDDLDDAFLAQAEFSATQAFRASHSNSNMPNVRSR